MANPRVQVVRNFPVRYAGGEYAFVVPERAENARVQAQPRSYTRSARVLTVNLRLGPDGVLGGPPFDDTASGTTIGATGLTAAIDVRGVRALVVKCTTGEAGSVDVFDDLVVVFDRGDERPSERPYA